MSLRPYDPLATLDRPVLLRMRRDLRVCPQFYGRRRHWAVKDPVALKYYHLHDEEYTILEMLDGRTSLRELQRRWESRFAPRRLHGPALQQLLGELHNKGLVLSDATEQGEQLLARAARHRWQTWLAASGSLLAFRLPGIDPEPWLRKMAPWTRTIFSRGAFGVWLIVVLAASLLVAGQFATFCERLPDFQAFFTREHLVLLALTLVGLRLLHEVGHALACHQWGGECHEMGVMLLVFAPCLYCDVSDAWMLPSKWARMAVSAAGMYVDLFLAAVATLVWWCTQPGFLNSLALTVMLIGSVSTLVFNGNPLMRFDGYYLLADWLEMPNLQSRSRAVLSRWLIRWLLGGDLPGEWRVVEERRGLLAVYGVASLVYRLLVVVGIFIFLDRVFRPYGLEILVQAMMVLVLLGLLAGPLVHVAQVLGNPMMQRHLRSGRLAVVLGLAAAVLATVLFLPLPCRVRAPLQLELADAQRVYVAAAGRLRVSVKAGQRVSAGDVLARLEDSQTERALEQLESDRSRQEQHVRHLEARRGNDAEAAARIPAARQALADLEGRLQQQRLARDLLTLRAPVAGLVIAPPRKPGPPTTAGRLGTWFGLALDEANRGCYLEAGTLFCLVGEPTALEAVAQVDQSDVDLIQPGQAVTLQLRQAPGRVLHGTVREISRINLEEEPATLAAAGEVPMRIGPDGVARPLRTAYQARISLDPAALRLTSGAPGRGKIQVAPQPLGRRFARYLGRTLRF